MNLAIIGYGLVRGREPEFTLLSKIHDVRIIGYRKRDKMHESGIENSERLEIVYPKIKPVFLVDPIFAMRDEYECSSWIYFEDLEKYLQDRDIVITHELWNFFSYQSVKNAKRMGIPAVVIVFETIPRNFIFTFVPPYSYNTRYVAKNADLFIAQTNKARSYLHSLGIKEEKIKVVYPGINLELFRPCFKKKNQQEIKILFVGNFIQKGLQTLLEAFIKLYQKYPCVSLLIVGNGPKDMIERIKFLEMKFPLKLFGIVPHNNMARIYRNADIFCMLSKDRSILRMKINEEQFGYALVEAMASGLPIVSTNCGAIPEIIGPKNFIVGQNSLDELIGALEILLEDEKLRENIGEDNRKRAETLFDSKKQFTTLMNYISSFPISGVR